MSQPVSPDSGEAIPTALLAQVHLGSWRWDIEPDVVKWSSELYRIFGFDPAFPPPSFADHPKIYSPASFLELESSVRHCLATGEPFALALDAIRSDGKPFFLEGHGAAFRDADGRISYLFGVALDRTTERRALLESQKNLKNYEAIFDQAAVGVVLKQSSSGKILHVNRRFAAMLGATPERLVGKSFPALLHGSFSPRSANPRERDAVIGGDFSSEMIFQSNTGEPVWVEVTVSNMADADVSDTEIVIVQDVSKRKDAQLARKHAEHAADQAQLLERQAIAQHMHDGTGQLLTGIALYADSLLHKSDIPEVHKARIAEIEVMAIETLRRVRAVSRGLMPVEVRPDTFADEMARLASNFSVGFGVTCDWTSANAWAPRNDAEALDLYLIAQEASLNAIRHGQARTIDISVELASEGLRLRIADDGMGFAKERKQDGVGLLSMRKRALRCGGRLKILPRESGGTVVVCTLKSTPSPIPG